MAHNIFASGEISEILAKLSSREEGLLDNEISEKQLTFGKNSLPEKKKNWIKMFVSEFTSPLVLILLAAVGVSLLVPFLENGEISGEDLFEPIAIFVILLFNALLGFWQELKAEKTLSALKTLQPEETIVQRGGKMQKILAEDLVPGDVVFLAEGETIPADIRLLEAVQCKVNESLLTGESTAVYKTVDGTVGASLGDTHNMLFSGSALISGRAKGVVTATGLKTEIGKIAGMLSEIVSPPTPLEQKLDILGKRIGMGVVAICLLIFGLSFLKGIPLIDALLSAVALAVGAVPEGLPAVMTISLAIGVSLMAKKNMLIRELKSVETLGSITVIASDKTGTITQNKMSVEEIFLFSSEKFWTRKNFKNIPENSESTLFFSVLKNCNDAKLPNIGDPTEIGLLQMAAEKNAESYPRLAEVPFSSDTKWMSTTHEISGKKYELIKGAPEVVSTFCDPENSQKILDASEKLAKKGIRCIGVAIREVSENSEKNLAKFLGIAGLQDPPREAVPQAISDAHAAGIHTLMITGDHAITAQAIAKKVGIESEVLQGVDLDALSDEELQQKVREISVYARVSPAHKVRICKALQANGEVVAMTGDGVNDAPAISQAQVGVAMGKVGTAVARGASDMVLLDDDFSTIVRGVREGRRIFSNIKKSVTFLLSTNFGEVLVLLMALVLALPLPLLPLHILLINLFTDSFPALALANEPAEKGLMQKKPRPIDEGFLHGTIGIIFWRGVMISAITLGIFSLALSSGLDLLTAQTIAFFTLSLGELFVIFSLRTNLSLFSKAYYQALNWWVVTAALGGAAVISFLIMAPFSHQLSLHNFSGNFWILAIGGAILGLVLAEVMKFLRLRK